MSVLTRGTKGEGVKRTPEEIRAGELALLIEEIREARRERNIARAAYKGICREERELKARMDELEVERVGN